MSARFRIRTSQGQELSFASEAVFVEFVRSGDLAPEDLVYDGESREWAPARTHPLVLEIQYQQEDAASGAGGDPPARDRRAAAPRSGDEGRRAGSGADDASLDELGLELAPPVEGLSPAEEAAVFLRKMEAERAMDLDAAPGEGRLGIVMEDSASLGDMISERVDSPPTLRPVEKAPAAGGAAGPSSPPRRPAGAARPGAPGARKGDPGHESKPPGTSTTSSPKRATPSPPRPRRRPRERARAKPPKAAKPAGAGVARGALRVVTLIAVAAVLAVAAYFIVGSRGAPAIVDPVGEADAAPPVVPTSRAPPAEPTPPPPPPAEATAPLLPATPEAIGARARERFLTTTQGLLRDLEPIPDVWLSGAYFALPSDHPRVRTTWQEYLATARRLRGDEEARYRTAYERALDDAAVEGDVRRIRTAAAMEAFAAHHEARTAHWNRVEALALAAIQSHDALVEAEGLVLHDPTGATGRSQGLGAGVTGRDSDTELLLEQVIGLLGSRLAADGLGPREGSNVREWVWGGFLAAATG